jgi:hypothetical protein
MTSETGKSPAMRTPDASLRASPKDFLSRLPGPKSTRWPDGERFVEIFSSGAFSVELYAPVGKDPQQPHTRDEVYFVISGSGEFVRNGERTTFGAGDALFVAAGLEHRFENFTDDFTTWVVFYGSSSGD